MTTFGVRGPPRGPCFGARFPVGQAGGTIVYCYPVSSHLCKVHFWKNSFKSVIFALSITAEWKKKPGVSRTPHPPPHPPVLGPFWGPPGGGPGPVLDPVFGVVSRSVFLIIF